MASCDIPRDETLNYGNEINSTLIFRIREEIRVGVIFLATFHIRHHSFITTMTNKKKLRFFLENEFEYLESLKFYDINFKM